MSDKITLLKQRYALEQRIRTLKNPSLTEGKDVNSLLSKMTAMLEHINSQINNESPDEFKHHDDSAGSYDSHPDHEVQMARSELYRAGQAAMALEKMLHHVSEEQGLEGWVQSKITRAADYLESVYHYLDYEMKGSEVDEAVAAYGPGQDPNAPDAPGTTPQGTTPPNQQTPGAASPTPPAGGSNPAMTALGMVKMAKLDQNKKPQGTPIMVKPTDIAGKQKMGFFVIGEAKEEKKVVHCSQCGKGFSAGGLKPPHHTGFSHCKDHKGMRVIAEDASAGASSAGAMGASPTGFAGGGIGMQKRKLRKKREFESEDPSKEPRPGRWMTRSNGQKYWMYDNVKEGWFSSTPPEPKKQNSAQLAYDARKAAEAAEKKAKAQAAADEVSDAEERERKLDVVRNLVSRGFAGRR